MTGRRHSRSAADGERGAVMVIFALLAPLMVLLLIYVIDVDNWLEHKRHLQVQADAGALAGAQLFVQCPTNPSSGSQSIYATAGQYAGASSVTTATGGTVAAASPPYDPELHNAQVAPTTQSNIHALINSTKFYNQPSTTSPQTPDTTVSTVDPCTQPSGGIPPMVDVKLTETNLPWFFRILNSVPFIDAQARVSVLQENTANNAEALAVADSSPVAATAYFVNEAVTPGQSGWILASTPLYKEPQQNGQGQDVWDNSGSDPTGKAKPLPVAVNKPDVGVVLAFSGNPSDTTCGHTYVQCFDESSTTGPSLLHIQGWSAAGTGSLTAPLARSVTLSTPTNSTCTDGYFSNSTATCTSTISAWVDYGTTNTKGVTVKPIVAGSTESALTPGQTSGTAVLWTGTASLQQVGSNQINLQVACTKGTGTPCASKSTSAPVTNVQRPYAAGTSSGTIAGAWLSEVGGLTQDANSFEVCEPQDNNSCTHTLIVTADMPGSLQNSQHYNDLPYPIRIGTSQGNVVGCGANASPSGAQYRQNLAQGCTGPFALNTSDPNCTNATVSPYDCVLLVSGVKNGPFKQGLSDRVANSPPAGTNYYCKNNWINNNNGGVPIIRSDDSRIINLFVMPYGSTDATGTPLLNSGYVPIENFATFYITGFEGDPCGTDDGAPPNAGNAWLVGHFIKYIDTLGDGTGSSGCVLNGFGLCVAVLTR